MDQIIPKKLHYCWFGYGSHDATMRRCMASWKKFAPDFELYEWNENTYDLAAAPQYVQNAYAAKKWAFVSDYVRLDVISKIGGVYVDTDMELVRDIGPLLDHQAFMGFEDNVHINNAIMGAIPAHPFIGKAIDWYKKHIERTPTPIVMTELFTAYLAGEKLEEREQDIANVHLYPHTAFYPYSKEQIRVFTYHDLSPETYAVHFWNYSWGHPLNRFFKKIGMHNAGTRITKKLGIKKMLKSIFHFE